MCSMALFTPIIRIWQDPDLLRQHEWKNLGVLPPEKKTKASTHSNVFTELSLSNIFHHNLTCESAKSQNVQFYQTVKDQNA